MGLEEAPLLVIWEVTRARDLACLPCRTATLPGRDPAELSTEEGFRLLDEVVAFSPVAELLLTGGDPLKRPDLYPLIRYAAAAGIPVGISLSATPLLTPRAVDDLASLGVRWIALGLDAPDAGAQARLRMVPATFDRAMDALRHARDIGLDRHVDTTVTRRNLHQLALIAERVAEVRASVWSLFFPFASTPGLAGDDLTGEEFERAFAILFDLARVMPFAIEPVDAPHYRRYAARRRRAEHSAPAPHLADRAASGACLLISSTGTIFPGVNLPLPVGNVRTHALGDVYRNAALFRILRDTSGLTGRCGRCEFQQICGGSRARAFAATGDPLAEDPGCVDQTLQEVCCA